MDGNNMDEKDLYATIYGILQLELRERKLVDYNGNIVKSRGRDINDEDTLKIYEFFANKVKDQSRSELNERVKVFNEKSSKLHDDYLVNMLLLDLFLVDEWLVEQPRDINLYITPKIKRLSKYAQSTLSRDVIKDSKIAASNIYRMMDSRPELTKEVREARLNRWRKACSTRT